MNTRTASISSKTARFPSRTRLAVLLTVPIVTLAGCYVMPVAPDGTPIYGTPALPPGAVVLPYAAPENATPRPVALNVRLYPVNDVATPGGVLTGQVLNLMGGRGRFQFNYQGETLVGEATRVSGDERRGLASAYGPRGTNATCEYQMSTPMQGAGTCTFSNGAKYNLHVGR